jgi:hypothetical protein
MEMGSPPDDKPVPDELAKHIGTLLEGTPKIAPPAPRPPAPRPSVDGAARLASLFGGAPRPLTKTAPASPPAAAPLPPARMAPAVPAASPAVAAPEVPPPASSQPDLEELDKGWGDEDDEEGDDAIAIATKSEPSAPAMRPRRKSAAEKAAARKKKAERRAERHKARAVAAHEKQQPKQRKAKPAEKKAEPRAQRAKVAVERSGSNDVPRAREREREEPPRESDTGWRGWRVMAILVAVIAALGGAVFFLTTRH